MNSGTPWTTKMNTTLIELLEDPGRSYHEVAAMMSAAFGIEITKNACIGKARRLGVAMRNQTPRPRLQQPIVKIRTIRADAPIAPKMPRRLKPGHVNIYELRAGVCRWPLGPMLALPPFMYCGEPADISCPYCEHHTRMARGGVRVTA